MSSDGLPHQVGGLARSALCTLLNSALVPPATGAKAIEYQRAAAQFLNECVLPQPGQPLPEVLLAQDDADEYSESFEETSNEGTPKPAAPATARMQQPLEAHPPAAAPAASSGAGFVSRGSVGGGSGSFGGGLGGSGLGGSGLGGSGLGGGGLGGGARLGRRGGGGGLGGGLAPVEAPAPTAPTPAPGDPSASSAMQRAGFGAVLSSYGGGGGGGYGDAADSFSSEEGNPTSSLYGNPTGLPTGLPTRLGGNRLAGLGGGARGAASSSAAAPTATPMVTMTKPILTKPISSAADRADTEIGDLPDLEEDDGIARARGAAGGSIAGGGGGGGRASCRAPPAAFTRPAVRPSHAREPMLSPSHDNLSDDLESLSLDVEDILPH